MAPTPMPASPPREAGQAHGLSPFTAQESPEYELLVELYYSDSWSQTVWLLHHHLGLSKTELARGAGVQPITISRWLEGTSEDVRASEALGDLRYVVMALLRHGAMSLRLMRFWLSARDVILGTDPLTAVSQGRFEDVVEAGLALSSLRPPH
jgi:hypothetical protein